MAGQLEMAHSRDVIGAAISNWLIDGAPIKSDPRARQVAWQPDGRGFAKLSVIDAKGRVDRVTVRLR